MDSLAAEHDARCAGHHCSLWRVAAQVAATAFFAANLVLAGSVLWSHDLRGKALVIMSALAGAAFLRFPAARKLLPFLAGTVGVFFGYQPYTYFSVAFTFLICLAGQLLLAQNVGDGLAVTGPDASFESKDGPSLTGFLLAAFAVYCAASLAALPGARLLEALSALGPSDFYRMSVFSPAAQFPYPLAALNRLLALALFASAFARFKQPGKYRELAAGLCCGLLTATVFGYLEFFRGETFIYHYRFQSIFANPGWYAEYAVICAPFLLVFLRAATAWSRGLAYAGLALVAPAVILTLARAGWLAFGLTLGAFAWLTFRKNPFMHFDRKKGLLPAVIAVYVCLLVVSFWVGGKQLSYFSRPINALLKERVSNFSDSPRPRLFKTGLLIGGENPLLGLGFESYALRYPVLLHTPGTLLHKGAEKDAEVFETTHNVYVQLFAGGGLLGLFLWLGLAGSAGRTFYQSVRETGSPTDLAMLLGLAAFHVYGFFQNMFYIPAAMLLVFLFLSRAMSLERGQREKTPPGARAIKGLALAAVVAGIVGYAADPGLSKLAGRHGLAAFESPDAAGYAGFFGPETIDGRTARWSCGASALRLPDDGTAELALKSPYPNPGEAGARLEIWEGGELLDVADFRDEAWIGRSLKFPGGQGGRTLYLRARPIYYPNVFGAGGDHRPLGAGVSLETGPHASHP